MQDGEQKINSELLKLLLELKEYSIIMMDATGLITSWNEGAELMYGYIHEEIIGNHESVWYTKSDTKNGQQNESSNQAEKYSKFGFKTLKRKRSS